MRIAQKRVDPQTGEEVPYEDIVKGYEIAPDRYVVIEPGELEALEPKKTKTIEIEDFVDLSQIDPIFYDHPYYLAPGPGGAKPYRLLVEAMRETGKVAIARVVIRSKEALVALRPIGDVLGMATMIFADEVLAARAHRGDQGGRGGRRRPSASSRSPSSSSSRSPATSSRTSYRDTYREQVLEMIERKAQGKEIAVQPEPEEVAAAGSRPDGRAEGEPRGRQGTRGGRRRGGEAEAQSSRQSRRQETGRQESAQSGGQQRLNVQTKRLESRREALKPPW